MSEKEFRVRHGLVVNNNVLVANTVTGNVGIGTANPGYTLDVFGTINAANVLMNGGAIAANLAPAFNTANAAYTNSNTAFDVANAAFGSANNVAPQIAPAFNTANAAFDLANTSALSGGYTSNAIIYANTTGYLTSNNRLQFLHNGNLPLVRLSSPLGNTSYGLRGFTLANSSTLSEDGNLMTVLTAPGNFRIYTYSGAYHWDFTLAGGLTFPDGTAQATAYYTVVYDTANAAFGAANNVAPQVTPAFNTANAAFSHSNITYNAVNSVFGVINAAYTLANTKYSSSGGTISGNVSILGDLNVHGNTYFIDQQTLEVSDPLIYLAGNNYVSDVVDIGFVANYVNASSVNVHTGLFRSAGTKEYYLFQGYDKEPDGNYIDPTGNNITRAVLNSDVRTSNLNLGGANAIVWIKSAYDTLNAGYTVANASFGKANLALTNVGQTAPGSATQGQMWWNSDLGRLYIYYTSNSISQWVEAAPTAASIEGSIVTGYINPVYDIANAAFGKANSGYVSSNSGYVVANAAFGVANTALQNTSGVTFAGNLYFPTTSNVVIGIASSYSFSKLVVGNSEVSVIPTTGGSIPSPSEMPIIVSRYALGGLQAGIYSHNTWLSNYANWLTFKTTSSANTTAERMRIDKDGNVGIGNTAPVLKLEVAGNMSVDAFVENSANITTSYTITTGRNAMTAGPVTLDSGVTITVPSGSTWTVV